MRCLLKGGQVYQAGVFVVSDVAVEHGLVTEISPVISPRPDDRVLDFSHCFVVPGFVDAHVHLREPGFFYKETIAAGTKAAAHGGYTTVCAMPNVNPPPDSLEHLNLQRDIIARDALIPVLPYGCITVGQKGRGELIDFAALAPYVCGFSDDGKGVQEEGLMEKAMAGIAKTGKVLSAHCEDESLLHGGYIHDGAYAKAHGHLGICSESETAQVRRDVQLSAKTGCAYHVCHVSAKETVEVIRQAKKAGINVTCETAPHYLILTEDDLQEDGRFKMNPPLREKADREALREGILDGTIDMIATDHAPHTMEEKSRGLKGSPMGITGLECSFQMLYTRLVLEEKILTLPQLINLMSIRPRQRFSIAGGLAVGERADITVIDPGKQTVINPDTFFSMGHSTPFAGEKVHSEIIMTMAGGNIVWTSSANL